jgi:hypothetical protein
MKKLFAAILMAHSVSVFAQTAADAAVMLQATVQATPPQIVIGWTGNATSNQYQVYRKLKGAGTWGAVVATLPGTATQYTDNTVSTGVSYEYHVRRQGTNYAGYGYINSGIEVPETDFRGGLILIVDSTIIDSLKPEISRLITDIEGDGWSVVRHDVLRTAGVQHVKSLIVNDYNSYPGVRSVFLLGHVPVPYSGNLNPDGHADHLGAWPADVYYGDINGVWTDVSVNSTGSPPRTQNVPGDGRFDQSQVPGVVELEVGRVDLANLSAFAFTEIQLLKKYLDKDHDYRKKIFVPERRAVIDDNFGYFSSEAFAASAHKNFSSLVGTSSVTSADYFTTLSGGSYLWSYGCGGGSYTSAGGVGTTANFAASNLQGVFTMLFGSYFGDWDINNNFLRAPLAQGKVLTNMWSGRPHYALHHMALGENIGYSLVQTQNNAGFLYYGSPTSINGKWIHNALMGDPTLRNNVVAPANSVVATRVGPHCHITWNASTDPGIVGYNIYMKNDSADQFTRLNFTPVSTTSFTDECMIYKGVYSYMVRAVKLEQTPAGSYFNMSEGISDTALNMIDYLQMAAFTHTFTGVTYSFSPTSTLATTHLWNFGDGGSSTLNAPAYTYTSNALYGVMHVAHHQCASDTEWVQVLVMEVGHGDIPRIEFSVFPNPAGEEVNIFTGEAATVRVVSATGQVLFTGNLPTQGGNVDLRGFERGMYVIELSDGVRVSRKRIIKQ